MIRLKRFFILLLISASITLIYLAIRQILGYGDENFIFNFFFLFIIWAIVCGMAVLVPPNNGDKYDSIGDYIFISLAMICSCILALIPTPVDTLPFSIELFNVPVIVLSSIVSRLVSNRLRSKSENKS